MRTLLALYQRAGRIFISAGFGDAATDLPLLGAVDRPILVPRADGALDPTLAANFPGAECAPDPGPTGWNAAVLALLEARSLPRVSAEAPRERP